MRISDWSSDVCASDLSSKPIGKAHAIDVRRLRIAGLGPISGRIDRHSAALLLDQAHRGEDRKAPPDARTRQAASRLDPLPGPKPLASARPGQGGKLLEHANGCRRYQGHTDENITQLHSRHKCANLL